MAVTSNFANCIGGRPIQFAVLTEEKFRMAEPSGLVIPIAFMISATTYEITTPISIGIILNIPFPQMLKMIITARATSARNQLVEALLIAEPARVSPIQMMTGPVTTGGRNLITRFTPTRRMIRASTRYIKPATTTPPQAYAALSLTLMVAYIPVFRLATVENPPRKAKEDPRNAGTWNLEHTWNRVPKPAQNRVTATVSPCVGPSPQASVK